jgi:hypothetical protein
MTEYPVMEDYYREKCNMKSDINEHLPTLRKYTEECNSVVECGVRDIVSSYAFGCGLKNKPGNRYVLIDPYKSMYINPFIEMCKKENVNASFIENNDLECELFQTDLLFIDTWHVYGQLKRELARWNGHVNKYIIMHDTTVDEWHGETVRQNLNAVQQSKESGIPVHEIKKGLWYAIDEFLKSNSNWKIKERFTNNNGLTILERIYK